MNWYLATVVYQIICGDGRHAAQFDEQLRLISAESYDGALEKARLLGVREEDLFVNDRKELVRWKFIDVSEVFSIQDRMDGAEVCSRIQEMEDAEDYINFVHHKASGIHNKLRQQGA